MLFRKESVESYETAMNITSDKINSISKEQNKTAQFINKLLITRTVNLKEYFTPKDVEKLRLMKINLRYDKIHSIFEIISLQADIRLYMINPPDKKSTLPLPTGITEDDVEQLLLITVRIMQDKEKDYR